MYYSDRIAKIHVILKMLNPIVNYRDASLCVFSKSIFQTEFRDINEMWDKKCVRTNWKSIKIKINLCALTCNRNTNEENEFITITREIEIGVICRGNAKLRRDFIR